MTLRRIDLYDTWPLDAGERLATLQAVAWSEDFFAEAFLLTRRGTLTLATELKVMVAGVLTRVRDLVVVRRVIRFELTGGLYRSYRIAEIDDDDRARLTTLTLQGPAFDLGELDNIVHEFDAAGQVLLSPKDAGKTPSTALTDRVLPALPAYWELGTITPTTMDDVEYGPGTTPLQAALAIAEAATRRNMVRYRLKVEENDSTGKMRLHLVAASAQVADIRPGKNLLRFLLKTDPRELTTRAIAISPNGSHCGKNQWKVTAKDTSGTPDTIDVEDLVGGPGPVQEDGQFEDLYLVGADGVNRQILASVKVDTETSRFSVTDASAITVGDHQRIALDSAGQELHYVDAPGAQASYGTRVGTFAVSLDDKTNFLTNADLKSYAEPPTGWSLATYIYNTLDGSLVADGADPTGFYAEDTSDFLTGGRSVHISGLTGGKIMRVQFPVTLNLDATKRIFSAAVWVKVNSAVVGTTGAIVGNSWVTFGRNNPSWTEAPVDLYPLVGKGWQPVPITLIALGAFIPSNPTTLTLTLWISGDVQIDAAQISEGQSIAQFTAGSGPAAMIQELNRKLYLEQYNAPLRLFSPEVVDLYTLNGTRYPYEQLEEGASIRLVHEQLAAPEVLEILRLSRSSATPLLPRIEVGSRRRLFDGGLTGGGGGTITPGTGPLPGGGGVIGQNPPAPAPPGATGAPGPQGPAGVGVPAGGVSKQVLTKVDATDFNTYWGPGVDDALFTFRHRLKYVAALQGNNTPTFQGINAPALVGTASAPTLGLANFNDSQVKVRHTSSAASNQSAGRVRNGAATSILTLGDAAGRGGFTLVMRFALATLPAATRGFFGCTIINPLTGAEPSAATDILGIGWDTSDTTFQVIHNDAAGAATKVDTLVTPVVDVVYEVEIDAGSNSTAVVVRLYQVDADVRELLATVDVATNLPTNTTFLSPSSSINTGAGTAACAMDLHYWLIDTR